jgi:hypothetical protein
MILALLFLSLGWSHNVSLMLDKAARYREAFTTSGFFGSLIGICQLLPLVWAFGWNRLRDPRVTLLIVWSLYAIAVLLVVRAPLWPRHFLPIVPGVMALLALGLQAIARRTRATAAAIGLGFCALNVAVALYQISFIEDIPRFRDFISAP